MHIEPMHVKSHREINTSFLLQVKAKWKVSKIKVLVFLIIHLATAAVTFLHFRIFPKRLVFTGQEEVFFKKW